MTPKIEGDFVMKKITEIEGIGSTYAERLSGIGIPLLKPF
jgi:hypothetical protein